MLLVPRCDYTANAKIVVDWVLQTIKYNHPLRRDVEEVVFGSYRVTLNLAVWCGTVLCYFKGMEAPKAPKTYGFEERRQDFSVYSDLNLKEHLATLMEDARLACDGPLGSLESDYLLAQHVLSKVKGPDPDHKFTKLCEIISDFTGLNATFNPYNVAGMVGFASRYEDENPLS